MTPIRVEAEPARFSEADISPPVVLNVRQLFALVDDYLRLARELERLREALFARERLAELKRSLEE